MHWIKRKIPKPEKKPVLLARILKVLIGATAAAWLQAIGALIALFLTLSLAYRAEYEASAKNAKIVVAFFEGLNMSLHEMLLSCEAKDQQRALISSQLLDDTLDLGKQIQYSELASGDIGIVAGMRRATVALRERSRVELAKNRVPDEYWDDCKNYAPKFSKAARALIASYAPQLEIEESDLFSKYGEFLEKAASSPVASGASSPKD